MEIGQRIKGHRARLGLSQDELAQRIYVSRQTISSWENDKTYPDVQSLLLLSAIFDATVDSLIKGDVEAMEKTIDGDAKRMRQLGWVMTVSIACMVLAVVWLTAQSAWDWPLAHMVPTMVLGLTLWGIALAAAVMVERIKKAHDLLTYREVLAFWEGRPIERDVERRRRESLIPRWLKVVRAVGLLLFCAAVGFFVGWHVASLINGLMG